MLRKKRSPEEGSRDEILARYEYGVALIIFGIGAVLVSLVTWLVVRILGV